MHTQVPCTQLPSLPQLALQWHVSRQVPLLQMLPAAHFTPAQRFWTHLPPTQTWLAAQVTPAHGLGATQESAQAMPAPQSASHPFNGTHLPVPALQY